MGVPDPLLTLYLLSVLCFNFQRSHAVPVGCAACSESDCHRSLPLFQDLTDIRHVSQLASEDLISQLTVRQCKRLLQYHRINYRNVIEKEELLQSVRQIWREMRQNAEGENPVEWVVVILFY